MDFMEELRKLTCRTAVSGHEDEMIDYMYDRLKMNSKDVKADRMGNVIAHFKCEADNVPTVIVFAHMDEIGFIVRKVDKNGFAFVERIGGVNRRIIPGTFIQIKTSDGYRNGVIGVKSHHYMNDHERHTMPEINELYIDTGTPDNTAGPFAAGIRVGDVVAFKDNFVQLSDYVAASKSIDNRAGCLCLLHLAELLEESPVGADVYLVGTVLEEFNLRGVVTAANAINPDIAICIDITPACDTPDLCDINDISLGKGPALVMYDFHGRGMNAGLIPNHKLTALIEDAGVENDIPTQRVASSGILTDASCLPTLGEGIVTASLAIPIRYSHTTVETADIRDMEKTSKLIHAVLKKINSAGQFDRRK